MCDVVQNTSMNVLKVIIRAEKETKGKIGNIYHCFLLNDCKKGKPSTLRSLLSHQDSILASTYIVLFLGCIERIST